MIVAMTNQARVVSLSRLLPYIVTDFKEVRVAFCATARKEPARAVPPSDLVLAQFDTITLPHFAA